MAMKILAALYGAYAVMAQTVLLRELAVLLLGHELFFGSALAAWLAFTGLGSFLFRDRPAGRRALFWLLAAAAGACLAGAVGMRMAKAFLPLGMMPGLLWCVAVPFAALGPACFLLGGAFPLIARAMVERGARPSEAYFLECLGGAAGGLLASLVLIGSVSNLGIILWGALPLLLAAMQANSAACRAGLAAGVLAAVFAPAPLERWSRTYQWRGYELSAQEDTKYSHVAVAGLGNASALFLNGFVAARFPDTARFEEAAHWPMLAHPKPGSVCLLGLNSFFLVEEVLKHPVASVRCVEPDGRSLEYLPAGARKSLADRRVTVETTDPLTWLGSHPDYCDVLLHGVSFPSNAGANRMFTLEFFKLARRALTKEGILGFTLDVPPNYIPPAAAYLAASIIKTAKLVFRRVEILPGEGWIVLSFDRLSWDPDLLAGRLRTRRISNQAVVPSYFPFVLEPFRRGAIRARLDKLVDVMANTDLAPVCYLYAARFWLSQVVSPKDILGLAIVMMGTLILAWRGRASARRLFGRPRAAFLFALGFMGMALETVAILAFQASSGALYWQMGILFAAAMAGLAAGVRLGETVSARHSWAAAAALAAIALPLSFAFFLPRLSLLGETSRLASFSGSFAFIGSLLGFGFSQAAGRPKDTPIGALYAADLWGSAIGAALAGAILVPLCGMRMSAALSMLPLAAWLTCDALIFNGEGWE